MSFFDLVRHEMQGSLPRLVIMSALAGVSNAALLAANMAIACASYRVTAKIGHHKVSFDSIKLALGAGANKYADYFETCRRKRNVIDYTRSHVATDTEAKEILEKATEFYEFVEAWIGSKFQALRR